MTGRLQAAAVLVVLAAVVGGCEAFVAAPCVSPAWPRLARGRAASGIRAARAEGPKWERPEAKGTRDVVFGARVNTLTPTPPGKADEGCSLSAYLQQPPEAFATQKLPEGASFERISDTTFRITVPKLQLLNVWLKPVTEADIRVQENGIYLSSTQCDLQGSKEVEVLDIANRFDFQIDVKISAREDPRGLRPTLLCQSNLNVWVDPPAVFRVVPKKVQEDTAAALMSATLNIMQGTFMVGLGEDYRKWSTDAALRKARASAGAPVEKRA